MLRITCIITALLAATGCGSVYYPEDYPDDWVVGCVEAPFFFDGDEDGWGDPGQEPFWACQAGQRGGFTARNGLDCDDSDAEIGAKLDAVCPEQLGTKVTGARAEGSEFLVVHGSGDETYALHAESACAAWGGQLATFDSDTQFAKVRDTVGDAKFAGYVGIQQGGDANCSDDDVCWQWTDDASLAFSSIRWCEDTVVNNAYVQRVAIVRPAAGQEPCLGTPDLVDGYEWNMAHYVCERDEPVVEDYEWWPVDTGGAE